MTDALLIDFADLDDVRRKLPAARSKLAELQVILSRAQDDCQTWDAYVKVLERRAGMAADVDVEAADDHATTEAARPAVAPAPGQTMELASEVVNREVRSIQSKDVAAILRREGHELPNLSVSNALFYAARRAKPPRVKQAGRGYYAPLSYRSADDVPADAAVHAELDKVFPGLPQRTTISP